MDALPRKAFLSFDPPLLPTKLLQVNFTNTRFLWLQGFQGLPHILSTEDKIHSSHKQITVWVIFYTISPFPIGPFSPKLFGDIQLPATFYNNYCLLALFLSSISLVFSLWKSWGHLTLSQSMGSPGFKWPKLGIKYMTCILLHFSTMQFPWRIQVVDGESCMFTVELHLSQLTDGVFLLLISLIGHTMRNNWQQLWPSINIQIDIHKI